MNTSDPINRVVAETYQSMMIEGLSHDEQQIHNDAVEAMPKMHTALKAKGFKKVSSEKSYAQVHHKYQRGNDEITITGWHGTRPYGPGKAIHGMYVGKDSYPYHPLHYTDVGTGDTITRKHVDSHREAIGKMHNYIASL